MQKSLQKNILAVAMSSDRGIDIIFVRLCINILGISALVPGLTNSARILDEITPDSLPPLPSIEDSSPAPAELPEGSGGAAATTSAQAPAELPQGGGSAAATTSGGTEHPAISFYMHDVLGGSHASGRIVTGLIATANVNGIPFSRPNNQVFPVSNGVPLANNNLNSLFNNNNVPFVAGLNGQNQQQSTVISNAGNNNVANNNNNNQAFVTPGQLPSGVTLQNLMFGSITVIDDELTEEHELGSGVVGRGQGFYLASSLDGGSHTMAFTALFPSEHGHEEDDTVSFFGVHRTASPISQIAIVGGTGKYENAKGYATIEALPQQDQHTTDGVDTIAHISVYITY
ncbi:dirigent protein 24-like isoform X1 [Silene latifolia]|uniref:dirigent protein 24-like isoform X1 n=1 Tax=Silene latifolia TaxID=37657 RepID=UPI003D774D16